MNTYTYILENKIYINLTNRCSNDCIFCIRATHKTMDGYNLWLDKEPTAKDIIEELEQRGVKNFIEIVFCGYGEPMYRWEVIKEVADYVHSVGGKTRINTNGQARLILGYDVTDEIGRYIDVINVSLNATSKERYQEVCKSIYGEDSFEEMLSFAKCCVGKCKRTILSVVDCIGRDEIAQAKNIADNIGAELRVRRQL